MLTLQCLIIFSLLHFPEFFNYLNDEFTFNEFLYSLYSGVFLLLFIPWLFSIFIDGKHNEIKTELKKNKYFYFIIILCSAAPFAINERLGYFILSFPLVLFSSISLIRYIDNLDLIFKLSDLERDFLFQTISLPYVTTSIISYVLEYSFNISNILSFYVITIWFVNLLLYLLIEFLILIKLGLDSGTATISDVTEFEDVISQKTRVKGPLDIFVNKLSEFPSEAHIMSTSQLANLLASTPLEENMRREEFIRQKFNVYSRKKALEPYELKLLIEAFEIPSRVPALLLALSGQGYGLQEISKMLNSVSNTNYYQYFSRLREKSSDKNSALFWYKNDIFEELSEQRVVVAKKFHPFMNYCIAQLACSYKEYDDFGSAVDNFRNKMGGVLDDVKKTTKV